MQRSDKNTLKFSNASENFFIIKILQFCTAISSQEEPYMKEDFKKHFMSASLNVKQHYVALIQELADYILIL